VLWSLGSNWLVLAIACVGILAFIVAMGLDPILRDEGFGPTGNAAIITSGFFATIYVANLLGYSLADLARAGPIGLAGAGVVLFVLIVVKAALNRF
jgi:hypothetical protein